ncbi:MAG: NUDIX hydrolase [Pseudomonadota bacterium]
MHSKHQPTTDLEETTLNSERVYDGSFLQIYKDHVKLPDGSEGTREYIQHPGAVMVIPMLNEEYYLMEFQYRTPFHSIMVEFPAGKVEVGEDTLFTAQRELEEETGYRAKNWMFLTAFHPIVSYTSETIYVYLATDLYATQANPDQGEFIETLSISHKEAMEWVKEGKIRDGKTMLGLLWLAHLGQFSCPHP